MSVTARALRVDDDLRLVPRTPADAPEFFAVVDAHRADLREWLPWLESTRSIHETRRYAAFAQAQFDANEGFEYAIREHGRLVGSIGIHHVDWTNRNAQFGYWVAPDARGNGIISRAARALTSHAFARLAFHRIEIRCVVENERSRRVAERLGYAFEGILAESYYLHGRYRDLALYAMTAARWSDLTTPPPADRQVMK